MSKWIWTVIACVAVAAVAFFGGVFVGRMTGSSGAGGFNRQGVAGFGQNGASGANGANRGGGFATGTVLKKDATGLTLKLTDGGSKTVILSSTTQFVKSEKVTVADVSVGATVTAIGTAASDGSITARLITLGDAGLGGLRGMFGGPGQRPQGQNGNQGARARVRARARGQGQGGFGGPASGPVGPG